MTPVTLKELKTGSKTKAVYFTPDGRRFHPSKECRGLLRGGDPEAVQTLRVPVQEFPSKPDMALHIHKLENGKGMADKLPCQVCISY